MGTKIENLTCRWRLWRNCFWISLSIMNVALKWILTRWICLNIRRTYGMNLFQFKQFLFSYQWRQTLEIYIRVLHTVFFLLKSFWFCLVIAVLSFDIQRLEQGNIFELAWSIVKSVRSVKFIQTRFGRYCYSRLIARQVENIFSKKCQIHVSLSSENKV